MARRSRYDDPAVLHSQLLDLIKNFANELQLTDLRNKVRKLVPIHHLLRDLGSSLISKDDAATARERILLYLRKYPRVVIEGDELMVISGIGEWARRVRELRVQMGWSIVTGVTAKEMLAEGELDLKELGVNTLKPNHYVLLSENQDREAAHRWFTANDIRKKKISVQEKILQFLKANVGQPVTGEELRYVAGNKTEWARRVRELRTEEGWFVTSRNTGRPDLPIGAYVLENADQAPAHDRKIPDDVRREVLVRDQYSCTTCGWTNKQWDKSDPRHLELHHVHQHAKGGANTTDNLTTLCNVCHKKVHARVD